MNPNEILKLAKDALERALSEKRMNADLLRSIGPAIVESLAPALEKVANSNKFNHDVSLEEQRRMNKEFMALVGPAVIGAVMPAIEQIAKASENNAKAIKEALSNVTITVTPEFKTPEIKIPPIIVPDIKLPTIVVPKITVPTPQVNFDLSQIHVPDIHMPDNMNVKGWVGFQGYDRKMLNDPLPVQLRDADGNPVKLFENLTSLMTQSLGSGGGFPMRVLDESTNALRVTGSFSISASNASSQAIDSSGNVYTVANPFPVQVVSGGTATSAVNLVDSSGIAYSGSNPVPTTASLSVPQGQGDAATAMRVVVAGNSDVSVSATQVGTWNIGTVTTVTTVTGITNSLAASLVDSGGIQYSGSNPVPTNNVQWGGIATPTGLNETNGGVVRVIQMTDSISSVSATQAGTWNIGTVTTVTGVTNSVAASLVDSTGVQYSGSNPVPITGSVSITGAISSTVNVGTTVSDGVDDGSAPVKTGGIARTANPTGVSGGDTVSFSADKLGRQLTRPVQVRDLIATAYVAVSTGTETTLKAAVAGAFLDCIMVTGSNNSDAAVSIDIRSTTAGNIVHTMQLAAYGLAGWAPSVPWPQDNQGNNWTVDLPDITGTTVSFSGLFSQEV